MCSGPDKNYFLFFGISYLFTMVPTIIVKSDFRLQYFFRWFYYYLFCLSVTRCIFFFHSLHYLVFITCRLYCLLLFHNE